MLDIFYRSAAIDATTGAAARTPEYMFFPNSKIPLTVPAISAAVLTLLPID